MPRKTRNRKQKGRGLLFSRSKPEPEPKKPAKFLQFEDPMNAVWATNKIPSCAYDPRHLNVLYKQMHTVLPPNTNIHSNNAEIMGALMETHNSPENMQRAVNLIYETEPLTDEEKAILRKFIKGPPHRNISHIAAANLPPDLKHKFLMRYRRDRATKKLKRIYDNSYISKYVHPEWNQKNKA